MTDKPLDCIGIRPSFSFIGKHDFRTVFTNVLPQPDPMTKDSLAQAVAMLKSHEQQAKRVAARGKVTQAFLDKLKESIGTLPEDRPVFSIFGFPIEVADDLPPGVVAEFRNADGEIVGRYEE